MNKIPPILKQSAQFIKGVGPRKIKLLNKLDIYTIEDLLYHFPRRYEDRSQFKLIRELEVGTYETIKGKVLASGLRRTRTRMTIFQLVVSDESGVVYGTWFNQPYLKDFFKNGDEVVLYGKVERYGKLQMNSPEYELLNPQDEDESTIHTGRIVPIYALTFGLGQRYLRKLIKSTLDSYLGQIDEFLPKEISRVNELISLKEALREVHFPEKFKGIDEAKRRLIFEEFFFLELALARIKQDLKENSAGIAFACRGQLLQRFKQLLPFTLTASQLKVISEIEKDMSSNKPMNRLLQGDVGSGKTVVSIWAQVICVQNGYQSALMAPTEILSEQHYRTVLKFLKPLGVKVARISSSVKKEEKKKLLSLIRNKKIDVVIGTHALIQDEVKFAKLGLAIVDEQHKFGVQQRVKLQKKGVMPDVLVMSATPIPRTLAITVFGDLDSSTIRELPPGRTPVETYWISEKKRDDLYEFLRKKIREGNQAYVVYPVIEKSKIRDLKAATRMYEHFKQLVFPDFSVGLLHGRMKDEEKSRQMELFKNRKLDLLVATTVIEVGIDIPNASVILIEHAERFGLSQLHQLRGRVGRGKAQAYCILLSNALSEDAHKRLKAMITTNDGFKIAEYDLLIRGPGEFFGSRQHGLTELKIGNILTDSEMLTAARKCAFEYLSKNPHFSGPEAQLLKEKLMEKFPHGKEGILSR